MVADHSPEFVGLQNYIDAFADSQFWISLRFTLKYTLYITPILMIGGYLVALLVTPNSGLSRFTRTIVFIPVVIGLGASSFLWYWLFSPNYGLVNKFLIDLGIIDTPILWLGVDADLSNWAIIISVTWKVLGFGMILFVAAIQAIPHEITEAAMVDGARVLAKGAQADPAAHPEDDPPGDPGQCDRVAPRLRPVLHHDRRPAAEPDCHVCLLRVSQLVPVSQTRLRGRPLHDPGPDHPRFHNRPDDAHPEGGDVTQVSLPQPVGTDLELEMEGVGSAHRGGRFWSRRSRYLLGAVSIVMCLVMLTPIVLSVAASLKTTQEAAAVPPTYFPSELSLDNYEKLWDYGSGLPRYLANSVITAFLTIAMTLILTVPAGYGLARFPIPGKELIFVFLLLALIIPYQALLTPIFLMFSTLGLTNNLFGLAIVHTLIQLPFSIYIMRNAFEAVPANWKRRPWWTVPAHGRFCGGYSCPTWSPRSSP